MRTNWLEVGVGIGMEIEAEIVAHLNDVLDDASVEITPATPLIEDRVLDSLGILDLIEYLEERYAVRFDDEEIQPESFGTVSAIAALLKTKLAGATG